jgi:bifunctional NMN adenylyltransferase/nudix hydrolase
MTRKTDVSVYIGRFNPFHKGHAHVLSQALENSKLTIVLVGSSGQARSLKNPFTFEERRKMIEAWQVDHAATGGAGFEHSKSNGMTGQGRSNLVILPIRDYPYNDALWIRQVQSTVKKAVRHFALERDIILDKISIVGSDRDESTWYLNAFPQWQQSLVEPYRQDGALNVSATDVRTWYFGPQPGERVNVDAMMDMFPANTMKFLENFKVTKADVRSWIEKYTEPGTDLGHIPKTLPKSTMKFLDDFHSTSGWHALRAEYAFVERYKWLWSVAPYAVTFVTVDAVVVQSGHVLVVRRGHQPGKGLWALPGGFLNPGERLMVGAIRELVEETDLRLAQGKNAKEITKAILKGSIVEHDVFDHPGRSSRGRTITTAYLFRLDDTKPLPPVSAGSPEADAPDEILECKWIPIDEALERTDMWFEDHHAILETLIGTKDL